MARALIVVDVQNDFCEGGSLAVAGGAQVAQDISRYIATHEEDYDLIVASRDWHPEELDTHFAANPDFKDTWPVHCVEDTDGAEYHPDLELPEDTVHVFKGQYSPAYSAFEGVSDGETLDEILDQHGITQVDVCGLATDYCVFATARDAKLEVGLDTTVLTNLVAAVSPASGMEAIDELSDMGVHLA